KVLEENQIEYTTNKMDVIQMYIDMTGSFVPGSYEHLDIGEDPRMLTRVISDESTAGIDVSKNEAVLTKPHDILEQMLSFKNSGKIEVIMRKNTFKLNYIELKENNII